VIVAVRETLRPGLRVTDSGVTVRVPIPGGGITDKLKVFENGAMSDAEARTVCVVVPWAALVVAVNVMVPVFPVPGPE
jgi:hypothetical protein